MKCIRCGNTVSMSSKYCKNCGTVISKDTVIEEYQPNSNKNIAGKAVGVILGIVLLIFVCSKLFSSNDSSTDIADNNYQSDMADNNYQSDMEYTVTEEPLEETEDFTEEETAGEETAGEIMTQTGDYVLPESHIRYLTRDDLAGLSAEQCRLARNEIYARHGRIFNDTGLQSYFESFDWYTPTILPDDFQESMLNEYEIANRDLIVAYEIEQGYR